MALNSFFLFMMCILPTILLGQSTELFIGTYTEKTKSEGIYIYAFDQQAGKAYMTETIKTSNPSFLTRVDENNLFVVNELGAGKGNVSVFRRTDGQEHKLTGSISSHGDASCHITIDKKGKYLLVSNYSGGSLSVFRTKNNSTLEGLVQHIQFHGSGHDSIRQRTPHIHSAAFSPDEEYVLVQDLGTDNIHVFSFERNREEPLKLLHSVKTTPGAGPRHLEFSIDGKFAYLVEEMGSRVSAYSFAEGNLSLIQQKTLLPAGFQGETGAADIHLSPDGRFLYASNRGDANDISIFKVQANGTLKFSGRKYVGGKGPRSFVISPNGKFLLVANQYSDMVKVFSRDNQSGDLIDTGLDIAVDSPVCLKF